MSKAAYVRVLEGLTKAELVLLVQRLEIELEHWRNAQYHTNETVRILAERVKK